MDRAANKPGGRRWLEFAIRLLPLLLVSSIACAHEPFEITTTVRMLADHTELRLIIADSTTIKLCMPNKASTELRAETFESLRPSLEACVADLFLLQDGNRVLRPSKTTVRLADENDLVAVVIYPPSLSGSTRFDAVHLKRLSDTTYGANFTATSENAFLAQKLLTAEQPDIIVSRDAGNSDKATRSSFSEFLHLGVEHILTGYDHLLFLAGLLIVCRRLRTALIIITSFTLAHSITLALAGLSIIDVPRSIIEPLIAATIVYVGIENIWRTRIAAIQTDELKHRWMLTFVFGLLHGFGFAGALRESGLPSDGAALVMPLFGFNLGVELGQIVVVAIFLPLLFYLQRTRVFARYGVVAISALVSVAGAYWLLDRTVL